VAEVKTLSPDFQFSFFLDSLPGEVSHQEELVIFLNIAIFYINSSSLSTLFHITALQPYALILLLLFLFTSQLK
jgi:hypothetical protein